MVYKVAHGTERVNMTKDFKVLLDSKGVIKYTACSEWYKGMLQEIKGQAEYCMQFIPTFILVRKQN